MKYVEEFDAAVAGDQFMCPMCPGCGWVGNSGRLPRGMVVRYHWFGRGRKFDFECPRCGAFLGGGG